MKVIVPWMLLVGRRLSGKSSREPVGQTNGDEPSGRQGHLTDESDAELDKHEDVQNLKVGLDRFTSGIASLPLGIVGRDSNGSATGINTARIKRVRRSSQPTHAKEARDDLSERRIQTDGRTMSRQQSRRTDGKCQSEIHADATDSGLIRRGRATRK